MNYGYIFVDPDHPDGPQFEIIPVREVEFHLNVLKFLEISPCTDCFRIVGFDFPEPDKLDVDIQIDHPFDDLDYSVFDVRAIIMFNGSHEFPMSGLTISDPALGDGAVLNPDGFTALYNGSTIDAPTGDFKKYFPGKLATPVVPDSEINGYKYFITDDPLNNRNAFYGGSSDVQTFSLQLPTGIFVIGYAVDASRLPPITSPVEDPLTDFDINANCTEPWKVVVTEEPVNGLTDYGGQTKLLIDVYDWQGKLTHHAPIIECPEIFNGTLTGSWISDGVGYTRYEVSFSNNNLAPVGNYICLVGIEALENNPADTPWLDLTAYQFISLEVTEGETGGDLIWAKQAGGNAPDDGFSVTALSDNSTVATGYFGLIYGDSATFGQDEPNETVLNSVGLCDIFIARYNPDGSLAWAKQAGGIFTDMSNGVTTLSDDSTIAIGEFKHSATFGRGEQNETVLITAGWIDIFIARYNPDGSLEWAKRAGGGGEDRSFGVTTLSDNSTVVVGLVEYSATFGEGEPNETVLDSSGGFIARYNPDGSLEWVKQTIGGVNITSLSDNSIVVTGRFSNSVTFGQGEPNETVLSSAGDGDIFIARYNPDGYLEWAKRAGGISFDAGQGITTLTDNTIAVTGHFRQSAKFGQGEPNETILETAGSSDIFIARYNLDGSLVWAKQAGGTKGDIGSSMASLSDNSTVVTGWFCFPTGDSATFGQGEPNQTVLNSVGWFDTFIARYNPDGSLAWVKQASGTGAERSKGVTTLSDDSTVVFGNFHELATFGQGEANETVLNSTGHGDLFIARYAE